MSTAKGIREVSYVDIQQAYPAWHRHHGERGFEKLGWHDCAGGGQVVVQDGIAYLGNMRNPRDARRMTSDRGRATYAAGLVSGVRRFLG